MLVNAYVDTFVQNMISYYLLKNMNVIYIFGFLNLLESWDCVSLTLYFVKGLAEWTCKLFVELRAQWVNAFLNLYEFSEGGIFSFTKIANNKYLPIDWSCYSYTIDVANLASVNILAFRGSI